MPLSNGDLPYTPIQAKVVPTPYPSGQCPQSPADLQNWFASFAVEFRTQRAAFAYTAGKLSDATPADRTLPRLVFDDQARYLGLFIWSETLGEWVQPGAIGELKTVVRSETLLADDLVAKNFKNAGWHLADGSTAGVPDLQAVAGFFQGAGPNYSVYTVCYTGT